MQGCKLHDDSFIIAIDHRKAKLAAASPSKDSGIF